MAEGASRSCYDGIWRRRYGGVWGSAANGHQRSAIFRVEQQDLRGGHPPITVHQAAGKRSETSSYSLRKYDDEGAESYTGILSNELKGIWGRLVAVRR